LKLNRFRVVPRSYKSQRGSQNALHLRAFFLPKGGFLKEKLSLENFGLKTIDFIQDVQEGRYHRMTDEILDFIVSGPLTKRQLKVFVYIYKKTIAYQEPLLRVKKKTISIGTNLDLADVYDTLQDLKAKNLILECPDEDDFYLYVINPKAFKNGVLIVSHDAYQKAVDNFEVDRANHPNKKGDSPKEIRQITQTKRVIHPFSNPENVDIIEESGSLSTLSSVPSIHDLLPRAKRHLRVGDKSKSKLQNYNWVEGPSEDDLEKEKIRQLKEMEKMFLPITN
jgi:phage replication O-like protein O